MTTVIHSDSDQQEQSRAADCWNSERRFDEFDSVSVESESSLFYGERRLLSLSAKPPDSIQKNGILTSENTLHSN